MFIFCIWCGGEQVGVGVNTLVGMFTCVRGDQRWISGLSWSFSTLHIEAGSFADPGAL